MQFIESKYDQNGCYKILWRTGNYQYLVQTYDKTWWRVVKLLRDMEYEDAVRHFRDM